MRTRILPISTAIIATLALASGPVFADDATGDVTAEECPAVPEVAATDTPTLEEAAEEAADVAEDLATDDDTCLSDESDQATAALQAALDRLSADDAGGNGVAAQVLQALLNGESPSTIGAAHGAAMALAAKEHRSEHATGHGKPDAAEAPETPDDPATPAIHEAPGRPADPGRP